MITDESINVSIYLLHTTINENTWFDTETIFDFEILNPIECFSCNLTHILSM
jgi:hypothetical protein